MADIDPAAQALAQDLMKTSPSSDPDIVIIATPLGSIRQALERVNTSTVKLGVMDIASVKAKVKVEVTESGLSPAKFLPTHPMAGREVGGAQSARADLFAGRPWIIDSKGVDENLRTAGLELIELLGASPVELDSAEHDEAVALVSHLPQIVASLLAGQLQGANPKWLELSGTGLRDTIRIASSSPELWKEIIAANRSSIEPLLRSFIADAEKILEKLGDEEFLSEVIENGRKGRALIPGKHGGKQRSYTYLPIVIEDKPGQLAALFDECAIADVNVEDLAIEHSPGQFTGLITLALSEFDAGKLADHLRVKGWSVHTQR